MRNLISKSASMALPSSLALATIASAAMFIACDPEVTPAPVTPAAVATTAAAAPPPVVEVAPAAPSPEELQKAAAEAKKAQEQKELAQEFTEFDASFAAEKTRMAALSKDVTALTTKNFATVDAAVDAVLKSPHRVAKNIERDAHRHPKEMLKFFGFKQNQAVLELDAGAGWYTELLAPLLAKSGKLTVTSYDPTGPRTEYRTLMGMRTKSVLDKSPEMAGKANFMALGKTAWDLGAEGSYDMVLALRDFHNWQRSGEIDARIAAVFKALKPGGVFGIEEHRAGAGGDAKTWAEKGYVAEDVVIERCKAAGFELAGKSEINANPKDTKDYAEGVWTLPPGYALGDKDKDKYKAIGESDRMTLKFTKPKTAAKPAAAAKPGAAAAPVAPAKVAPAPVPAKK
jgi:predicted methyltransferase